MTEGPSPFVPISMAGGPAPAEAIRPRVVYVKYRAPAPLEFPGVQGILPGPVFHVAGVLLREDDEFLALGEVAFAAENPEYARRFGKDMFPAFRHILTIPKASILERKDLAPWG